MFHLVPGSSAELEKEMAFEIRDSDDDQLLSGGEGIAKRMICAALFSEDNDGEVWTRTLCADLHGEVFVCDMCN
jgi:hypothetical protein